MKTPGMIAQGLQKEMQKAEMSKALERTRILKECCDIKWTFATKKLKGGSCILLAKQKYGYDKYRAVSLNGNTLMFQTKTSAHNAAKNIAEMGLENSGYELGEAYEI